MKEAETIQLFFEAHRKGRRKPIIKGFLRNEENYKLLIQYILNSTEENKEKLDTAFKEHFEKVREIKFYNTLIRISAIDYDKKVRKFNGRFSLTLDQPVGDSEHMTNKDMLVDTDSTIKYEPDNFDSLIGDKKLKNALKTLTAKQLQILELIYIKDLSNLEIAEIINSTPQNICNTHRKSLKKLRESLKKNPLK